jgi:hypothetical protein
LSRPEHRAAFGIQVLVGPTVLKNKIFHSMKNVFSLTLVAITMASLAMTPARPAATGDPCGVISLGSFKTDLSARAEVTSIPKESLIENFKAGIGFSGSEKCPGTFEITGLTLRIDAANDHNIEYDLDFVQKMQSMERYMLARYFNGAQKLTLSNITVQDADGASHTLPSVSFTISYADLD